jgi:nucleoside-diphosphate-sugar epimerase
MVREIISGSKIAVVLGLLRYADGVGGCPAKGALSIQRAQSELGYHPRYDLFEGLRKYADSLRREGI